MTTTEDLSRFVGRAFRPEAQENDSVDLMVQLLDFQDEAPSIRRLRDWALQAARPKTGEIAVDLGSGTGTMARELVGILGPTGSVVGVEPNPRLRQIAVERAAGLVGVTFVDGLAGALPFPDGSVDLVWCERVLQHLTDPQAAVTDLARVLRPGGRAVLLDSDHASRVSSDVAPAVEALINEGFNRHVPNANAARHIPRQAIAAGLEVDEDIGSAALIMPPAQMSSAPWLAMAARRAVDDGLLAESDAAEAIRSHSEAIERGYAFSAVTVFGFLARKPQ